MFLFGKTNKILVLKKNCGESNKIFVTFEKMKKIHVFQDKILENKIFVNKISVLRKNRILV